jgi:hypothetical protein
VIPVCECKLLKRRVAPTSVGDASKTKYLENNLITCRLSPVSESSSDLEHGVRSRISAAKKSADNHPANKHQIRPPRFRYGCHPVGADEHRGTALIHVDDDMIFASELALQLQVPRCRWDGSPSDRAQNQGGQRQLGMVHDGTGSPKSAVAAGRLQVHGLVCNFLARPLPQPTRSPHIAIVPARFEQVPGGRLIWKVQLKLDQGARKRSRRPRRRIFDLCP